MSDTPDDLIGAAKAKRILNCHPGTLHRWRDQGRLRAWRLGGRYLYSEAEVRALLVPVTPPQLPASRSEREGAHRAACAALRAMGVRWDSPGSGE